MKKFSFLTAALALVLGLSQCAKPNLPTPNGIGATQEVTLTTSFDDGSKVSGDYTTVTKELKLTWDGDETIEVTAGGTGTLQCTGVSDDGKTATFTGTVTHSAGDLTFSVNGKTSCDYMQQDGTMDWIMNNIVLQCTCQFNEEAEYGGLMELPFAVAKLDLSAFGTAAGSDVTVSVDNATIVTVKGVKDTKGSKFVALPVAGSKKDYKFQGTGDNSYKNLYKTWTLEKNKYYTKADAAGQPTGNDIVIPTYSVAADRTVTFAPGNLYSNGSDTYFFQPNQWDYTAAYGTVYGDDWLDRYRYFYSFNNYWKSNYVTHLFFEDYAHIAYADNTDASGAGASILFTNETATTPNPNFTVNGQTGVWRTLSNAEWKYLLNERPNASNLRCLCILDGPEPVYDGNIFLCILPDGGDPADFNRIEKYEDLELYDAICLQAAGTRRLVKGGGYISHMMYCDWDGELYSCGFYQASDQYDSDYPNILYFFYDGDESEDVIGCGKFNLSYTDVKIRKNQGNTIRCVR